MEGAVIFYTGLGVLFVFLLIVLGLQERESQHMKKRVEKIEAAHAFKRKMDGLAAATAFAEEQLAQWRKEGRSPSLAEFERVARHWDAQRRGEFPFDDEFDD